MGELLSIGDVAEATGLSPDLIRMWERRYGCPVAVRLPSGHRRYRAEDLPRLRLVAAALARGLRPSQAWSLSDEDLKARAARGGGQANPRVALLLEAVGDLDAPRVRRELQAGLHAHPLPVFLCEVVSPLLEAVGLGWAEGRLGIEHEHFLTELLEDLLRDLRRELQPREGAPCVMLATLPGEQHRLGLLMAALVYGARGDRVEVLGPDLPLASMVAAARALQARTVGISISLQGGGELTRRLLQDLRERLPEDTALVIGGQGAARLRRVAGVVRVGGLEVGR